MTYPFLPVNPCCTDVVINNSCGCSPAITNHNCGQSPCGTNVILSSNVLYNGPVLDCIIAEPCDTLNVILQKIDEIICNLLTQINSLNIQVNNITQQIININGDIININNTLDVCCNVTTTTSTSSSTTTTSTTLAPTTTTTTTTIASMCFYMGGETSGDPYSCTIEPEAGLVNGKPYYKLLLPDCTTPFLNPGDEPVYVWFSTSGDYVNQWVVSELNNATFGNVYSYISSVVQDYPVGDWEIIGDQFFVSDSTIGNCPEFICFAIFQESEGDENPILYTEEIPLEGNAPFQNGRPVYNIEGPFPGSLYYNGSQWVYAVEDFAPGLQPLLNSSYYPIGTYSEWGSPGVTGVMYSSTLNGCPSAVPA